MSKYIDRSRYVRIQTKPMLEGLDVEETTTDRQEKVPGFSQDVVCSAGVFSVGAGGLFAEQGRALVRKGYGYVACADMDVFTPSNYARQLCYAEDLYQSKALSVAKNLANEAILKTEIVGLAMPYEDARHHIDWSRINVELNLVDSNGTRVTHSVDARKRGNPVIFCAVSGDANSGYCFVQDNKPDSPCFGCAFPHKVSDKRIPCPGTPACVDILKVIGGFSLYAIDSLLMNRPRKWNLRHVFLAGHLDDAAITIEKNPECPLCGKGVAK